MDILTPRKSLNKAYLKQKISRQEMERFKTNLQKMLSDMNPYESEEYHKNLLNTFLNDTWYKGKHFINTRERTDLVIHSDKKPESAPAVLIETKKPGNQTEMPSTDNLDAKAVHELIRYYLHERIDKENIHIRQLVVTDLNNWFVFDENEFDRYVYRNKKDVKEHKQHAPNANISALEAEIDEMVYDLYGLTVEEGWGRPARTPNP
ncbi:MAG: hypothetical protein KGY70_15870 [Bacteroidales bacterium]|nr:hypothetical protein [Bacteroidales bacterium]MBS3776674.1 hypothetical protein [Bacteroidales bacterium]